MRTHEKREYSSTSCSVTGLHLLDSLRERLRDNVHEFKDGVGETYDTASERVSRATAALRGEEDRQLLGKGIALLIGVGIGVGIC